METVVSLWNSWIQTGVANWIQTGVANWIQTGVANH